MLRPGAAKLAASHTPTITLRDYGQARDQFLWERIGVGQEVSRSRQVRYEELREPCEKLLERDEGISPVQTSTQTSTRRT